MLIKRRFFIPKFVDIERGLFEIFETVTGVHFFGHIHSSSSNEPEIKRWASLVWEAVFAMDQNICRRSSILLETKLHLYNTRMLRIYLYRAETRSVIVTLSRKTDSLDNWTGALGASSASTGQSLLPMMRFVPVLGNRCCQTRSGVVICPSLAISTEQIHARTTTELCSLQACIADPPADGRRRPGCSVKSWLRPVETDLRPLNLGLATAKQWVQDRVAWRRLVATAT